MRFDSIEIRNYKGIAFAELHSLASESVVTISGRNGTGKSLLLEAVVGAWSQRYSMAPRVGPWGDDLSIKLSITLTSNEWEAVDAWHQRFRGGGPAPRDDLTFTVTASRAGHGGVPQDSAVLQMLRDPTFQRSHGFSPGQPASAKRGNPLGGPGNAQHRPRRARALSDARPIYQ